MKRVWSKERKWVQNKLEFGFERKLKEDRFEIKGYQEYNEKTIYLISKDGMEFEYEVPKMKLKVNDFYKGFMRYYILLLKFKDIECCNK